MQEKNTTLTKIKLSGLSAGIVLIFAAFAAHGAESHMAQALQHAEAAAKATDAPAIAEHAEAARTHAKTADEHLDAGITSLDGAIEHGKLGHPDLAKHAAEDAVTHLKAAQ